MDDIELQLSILLSECELVVQSLEEAEVRAASISSLAERLLLQAEDAQAKASLLRNKAASLLDLVAKVRATIRQQNDC